MTRYRPKYCEAPPEESGLPCACGATVEGRDPVKGVCQARHNGPRPTPYLVLVLTDKESGEII